MKNSEELIVDFLFEVGILAKIPRSGFPFLGSGQQSVAEHTHRTVMIGYVLASLEKDVDTSKVIKMCLFHDMAESRTSDLNHLSQKYVKADEAKVIDDMTKDMSFSDDIKEIIDEYEKRETKEAIITKEADNLELILKLKEELDIGNKRVNDWIKNVVSHLRTEGAKKLAQKIITTDSDNWWFGEDKLSPLDRDNK